MAIQPPATVPNGEAAALRRQHKAELEAREKEAKNAIKAVKGELERVTEPTLGDVAVVLLPQLLTSAADGIVDAKLIAPRMANKQPTGAPVVTATVGLLGTIGGMVVGHKGTVNACGAMLGNAAGAIARGTLAGLLTST